MGSLTDDYPGLNPITIENRQIKEECPYPLTKSAGASVPSNSVITPVVKPEMPVAGFNSLGWATKRGGRRMKGRTILFHSHKAHVLRF